MSEFQILRSDPFQVRSDPGGPPELEAPCPPPDILRLIGDDGEAPPLLLLLGTAPTRRKGGRIPPGKDLHPHGASLAAAARDATVVLKIVPEGGEAVPSTLEGRVVPGRE